MSNHFLSTAIPYVNGAPHVGHAFELVIADAITRHRRRLGVDVRFQSGTDDNGLKNARAAEALGRTPAELVARHAAEFQSLARALDVSLDDFVKTSSDPRHAPAVHRLWRACEASGDLERRPYTGLYCGGCEQFFTEGELPGNRCPEHAAELEVVRETNYFFRASRYGARILEAIQQGALRIRPESRRAEVVRFLSAGLHDFSVSRSAARAHGWGLTVPDDPGEVIYVWFDALTNYLSTLGYGSSDPLLVRHWHGASARTHVIGKGVLRFHAAYWPALLLSAGLPLPTEILAHGYVTVDGRKIGKSAGNAVSAQALVVRHGSDAFRYHALRHLHTTEDSDFSEARLVATHDSDLADTLGNLLRRTTTLVARDLGGRVPEPGVFTDADQALRDAGDRTLREQLDAFDRFDLNEAAAAPFRLLGDANRYLDAQAPWSLAKHGDRARLATVLFTALETLWRAAWLLGPIVPRAAARIRADLGGHEAVTRSPTGAPGWARLPTSVPVTVGEALFPKARAR